MDVFCLHNTKPSGSLQNILIGFLQLRATENIGFFELVMGGEQNILIGLMQLRVTENIRILN